MTFVNVVCGDGEHGVSPRRQIENGFGLQVFVRLMSVVPAWVLTRERVLLEAFECFIVCYERGVFNLMRSIFVHSSCVAVSVRKVERFMLSASV